MHPSSGADGACYYKGDPEHVRVLNWKTKVSAEGRARKVVVDKEVNDLLHKDVLNAMPSYVGKEFVKDYHNSKHKFEHLKNKQYLTGMHLLPKGSVQSASSQGGSRKDIFADTLGEPAYQHLEERVKDYGNVNCRPASAPLARPRAQGMAERPPSPTPACVCV